MGKYIFNTERAISWSSISLFEYSREKWFEKYVLGIKDPESPEMIFGKKFAESVEKRDPLAPVTILKHVEYPLLGKFGGIPIIGYIDAYEPGKELVDHKTGAKEWTQKRADEHGQLTMYLFMLFLLEKVKPDQIQCAIEWIPTAQQGDFTVDFVRPIKVHRFPTKRTTQDVLEFGAYIKATYRKMQDFVENHA